MNYILNFDDFIEESKNKEFTSLIEECYDNGVLNEGKVRDVINKSFNNFKGLSKTMKSLVLAGTIGLATAISIINISNVGTETEKQELIQEITEITETEESSKYVTDFEISDNLIDHLKEYEQFRSKKYFATAKEKRMGKYTIGYGHVIKKTDPSWIKNCTMMTEEEAFNLLKSDVQIYKNEFDSVVQNLPEHLQDPTLYTQGFVDACISIVYNCGKSNFLQSPFFKTWKKCRINPDTGKIRQDDFDFTCSMIKKTCITQKGKKLNGLVNRRAKEYDMATEKALI